MLMYVYYEVKVFFLLRGLINNFLFDVGEGKNN